MCHKTVALVLKQTQGFGCTARNALRDDVKSSLLQASRHEPDWGDGGTESLVTARGSGMGGGGIFHEAGSVMSALALARFAFRSTGFALQGPGPATPHASHGQHHGHCAGRTQRLSTLPTASPLDEEWASWAKLQRSQPS